jgi:hypothetical protein
VANCQNDFLQKENSRLSNEVERLRSQLEAAKVSILGDSISAKISFGQNFFLDRATGANPMTSKFTSTTPAL